MVHCTSSLCRRASPMIAAEAEEGGGAAAAASAAVEGEGTGDNDGIAAGASYDEGDAAPAVVPSPPLPTPQLERSNEDSRVPLEPPPLQAPKEAPIIPDRREGSVRG